MECKNVFVCMYVCIALDFKFSTNCCWFYVTAVYLGTSSLRFLFTLLSLFCEVSLLSFLLAPLSL